MPRIGEYELLETIAKGAFAKVKMARHIPTDTMWAAKIIPKTNRDVEKDIRVEINVMRRLSHEHVVRLNEILESQNNYYIILEPAMGGDLCELVMKNPSGLPEKDCARIFMEILRGLKACHQNRVAHRDLKPENILFTETNMVKISDFGLSRLHKTSVNEATSTEYATTLTGTPQYVAPEVLLGPYDAFKSDLWSLGCIMYVMLTSRFPFGSAKDQELDHRIKAGTYEKLPAYVSPDAADLVASLLKINPNERLPLDHIADHPFLRRHMEENFKRKFDTNVELQAVRGDDFQSVDDDGVGMGSPLAPRAGQQRRKLPGAGPSVTSPVK